MSDIRQSVEYARVMAKNGWSVKKVGEVNIFIKHFPIIGNFIKVQRPSHLDQKTLNKIIKNYKAFRILIAPSNKKQEVLLTKNGFKGTKSPYIPTKTLIVNLSKSKESILNSFKKDAKYSIKKSTARPIETTPEKFHKAFKKAVGVKRHLPPIQELKLFKKYFTKNCLFLMDKNMSSGALFLVSSKKAYYWLGFTDKNGRKNLSQYKILWDGMLWAKKHGIKSFDMEGVYDKRFPVKSWLGFSHFKKSFGGKEINYPGEWGKYQIWRRGM